MGTNTELEQLTRLMRGMNFIEYPIGVHGNTQAERPPRIGKKDRPKIGPFSIQDAEVLIAAIHRDWGEAHGNYDEFRLSSVSSPGCARRNRSRSSMDLPLLFKGNDFSQTNVECHPASG
jgi:hypothetical protein